MSALLANKVCLVTGAGHGIGKAIAKAFIRHGALVYANDRLEGTINWNKNGDCQEGAVKPLYFDVTDRAVVKQAVMTIKKEQGRIDVLVNNAGIAYNEKLGMIAPEHVEEMFRVNVYAVLEIMQLVSRVMTRQNNGSIINISSIVGLKGDKGQVAYSATKGAVIAMTKSAAKELAPHNIRVNSIAPGLTNTDMFRDTDPRYLDERMAGIGMKRLAEPEDMANACVFLASDLSQYVSGQIIGVDGCSVL